MATRTTATRVPTRPGLTRAAAVLLVALAACGGGGEPELAAAFRLPDVIEGRPPVDLLSHRGTPVVLNFWGSWCVPCEKELPAFVRVHRDLGDRVAFVGVNSKDSRRMARRMIERLGVPWPSAYDPSEQVARANDLRGYPVTLLIDAEGRVVHKAFGELDDDDLRALVAEHFGVGT